MIAYTSELFLKYNFYKRVYRRLTDNIIYSTMIHKLQKIALIFVLKYILMKHEVEAIKNGL